MLSVLIGLLGYSRILASFYGRDQVRHFFSLLALLAPQRVGRARGGGVQPQVDRFSSILRITALRGSSDIKNRYRPPLQRV